MQTRSILMRVSGVALVLGMLVGASGCTTAKEVVLREQARQARDRGQMQQAQTKYEQLVELNPTSAQYQHALGASYLASGKLDAARIALEQARELAYDRSYITPRILDKLAETYYRQDDLRRLTGFLNQTAKQRGTTRSYLRQAQYLRKIGDMDAARVAYRKAAYFAEDGNAQPYVAMADFYQSIGDRTNAVKALRYAYHVAPGDGDVNQRLQSLGVEPASSAGSAPPKPALLTQ
jgi:Flp pilus assembly protein TadD